MVLRRRSKWVPVLAAIFVCLIVTDLALDARCDDGPLGSYASATVSNAAGVNADACASGCVPDCYCCAQTLPTATLPAPSAGEPVGVVVARNPTRPPDGVSPLPYHPPLARA